LESFEQFQFQSIERSTSLERGRYSVLDFSAGSGRIDSAARYLRQMPCLFRIVAFVADGDQGIPHAERKHNLGGTREK